MRGKRSEADRPAVKPYPMNVYQDLESGDWVAEVTDLPGCIGVGESPEKAVSIARSFVHDWIEEAASQGWNIPEPTPRVEASGKFVVRLPKTLHARLQALAEAEETSLNQVVVALLGERVTRHETLAMFQEALRSVRPSAGSCPVALEVAELAHAGGAFGTGSIKMDLHHKRQVVWVAEPQGSYGYAQGVSHAGSSDLVRQSRLERQGH